MIVILFCFLLFAQLASCTTVNVFTFPGSNILTVNGTANVDSITGDATITRTFSPDLSATGLQSKGCEQALVLSQDNTTVYFYPSTGFESGTITTDYNYFLAASSAYVDSGVRKFLFLMTYENEGNPSNTSYLVSATTSTSGVVFDDLGNITSPPGYTFSSVNTFSMSVDHVTGTLWIEVVDNNFPGQFPYALASYDISTRDYISVTPTVFNEIGNFYVHNNFAYLNNVANITKFNLVTNEVKSVVQLCHSTFVPDTSNVAFGPSVAFSIMHCSATAGANDQLFTIDLHGDMSVTNIVGNADLHKVFNPTY